MFRVLIVDDESALRYRLRNAIDWEENGFTIVGEASDGEEALDIFLELKPDVIFTDIRMPVVNGLELARSVNQYDPGAHIVIISGYGDFEYAQEAIKYGVKEYLLKPVEENELKSILKKIKTDIENNIKLSNCLSEANYALREKLLTDILHKRVKDGILEQGRQLGLDFGKMCFGVLIVEIDDFDDEIDLGKNEDEIQIIKDLVKSCINERANNCADGIIIDEDINRFIVFSLLKDDIDHIKSMRDLALDIKSIIEEYSRHTVTIGLGEPVNDPALAHGCYKEAKLCLEGKFLLGKNRILTLDNIVKTNGDNSWKMIFGWDRNEFYESIENNDRESIKRIISQLFGMMRKERLSARITNPIIIENLIAIGRMIKKIEGDLNQIFGDNFNVETFLKKPLTIEELEGWFTCICIKASDYILKVRKNRPKKVSQKVIEIVDSHYSEDLSLRSIAKVIYMSPVYLGQVFKNETGKTFSDYLTEVRIKNSVKLLIETDMHIYEVSEKVGYQAPSNFFAAFRKIEGCSPLDYRKKIMRA